MVSLGHNELINFLLFSQHCFLNVVISNHSTLSEHAVPLNHYIHISISASSVTCSSSTTKKHHLNLLSSITKALLTHTLASFWRKQSCFFEMNRKPATGNPVMFILLHSYSHRGFVCGKMITFTLKIFNIFGDVYTRDGTISLCQRDASAQIVVSHNYRTQVLGSIPFTPSVATKWHDRHRYLSIHHMPYLMSLSSPRHCSKTLRSLMSLEL